MFKFTLVFCSILIVVIALFLTCQRMGYFCANGHGYISNKLMTCTDSAGVTSYTIDFKPNRIEHHKWFDENDPLILASSDFHSKNYKVICNGSYNVSTTRGNVIAYFAILESTSDGKWYFSHNSIYEINQYIFNEPEPSPSNSNVSEKITCFPIIEQYKAKAIELAKNHVFESLKDVK